ncbi:MAG: prolyl oligopeptidase family serine peptidase [Thermoanaerobaculia bacterium]
MRKHLLFAGIAASLFLVEPSAGAESRAYQQPVPELISLIDAPGTPALRMDRHRQWLLLLDLPGLPPVSELVGQELRLGGLRFRPASSTPSRLRGYQGLKLLRVADGYERPIEGLPASPRILEAQFSPDGSHLAAVVETPAEAELWVVELASGKARRLGDRPLSLVFHQMPVWEPGSDALLATVIPAGRGPAPRAPELPEGPVVQGGEGEAAPSRTHPDLLASPQDEALFEYYTRSQLVRIRLDGKLTPLGEPGMIYRFDPAPDAKRLLVEQLARPFSYLVQYDRFPSRAEIWDRQGKLVRRMAELPLAEQVGVSLDSVVPGPRFFDWRADQPATLTWVEALDGGDAEAAVSDRDALYQLAPPYDGKPQELLRLGMRFKEARWGTSGLALVREEWRKTRRTRTWRLAPGQPGVAPRLVVDRSAEDRYHDPGVPQQDLNEQGRPVLLTSPDGQELYLAGDGASPEGSRPFLDALNLETGKARRLFWSEPPHYEKVWEILDPSAEKLLISQETPEQPPNFFVKDIRSGALTPLTHLPNPAPELAGLKKELLHYQRGDGVALSATLYTPPGWKPEDGPLPLLMLVYPQEFKTLAGASQVNTSPYKFSRLNWSSPVLWVARGYAVLDDPALPIVGEGEARPNDRYVSQLVAGAKAAVDEVVRLGVADPKRIAVAGHSYGAFTVANLLVHTDLFAAGIAASGAYNRTLTPFGFQWEDRTLWQAPEVYLQMSPFLYADRIKEPLLLIHGEADDNAGTFPIQSERFFDALKGLGARTRLVMLPYEGHAYRSRESILHLLWEVDRWLETNLKKAS